jgi:hypothetical protein
MKNSKVATIVKGMSYSLPTYTVDQKGNVIEDGNISIKFCNRKSMLSQKGVDPIHLLQTVCKFIKDEDYAHREDIIQIINDTESIIRVAQRKKMKGRNEE